MRLAEFIRGNMESILADWEAFASTIATEIEEASPSPSPSPMTSLELRNHAKQILEAIAKDISTEQSAFTQRQKSLGRAPALLNASETAAETHAVLRERSGFDINQLVAEYRALRASVLRLWEASVGEHGLQDVIRFNEAIDQALAESVTFYSAQVERSRALLQAMVGHDMRSPLNAIQISAWHLDRLNLGPAAVRVSERLIDGSSRMAALLDDLVDFSRSQLGLRIPVSPAPVNLAISFSSEIELLRFANPDHPMELTVEGDVSGSWDERRLQQMLSNLVMNAVKYGTEKAPVRVRLSGDQNGVKFEVRNEGRLDTSVGVERLFDPLRRGADVGEKYADSLGLGLYIAREIAVAHGGQISAHSHETATVFAVSLPR